jgi:hypothetical protein
MVSWPVSLVVICTSLLDTAKCTNAREPNPSKGSPLGSRWCLYCKTASVMFWVKSVFNSAVATGMPLTNNARSMPLLFWVE